MPDPVFVTVLVLGIASAAGAAAVALCAHDNQVRRKLVERLMTVAILCTAGIVALLR